VPPTNERVGKHRQAKHAKVIEHIEGRYETQEVPFGIVYKWSPKCLVVECGCGERTTLTSSMTTCTWCDTNHAAIVREELAGQFSKDEALHPWRYAGDREGLGLPC